MNKHSLYRSKITALLFILPTLIILTLFLYYPTIETFKMSMYRVAFLGLSKQFVGLENYRDIFLSAEYRKIFVNTGIFVLISVVVSIVIGLFLAVLANQKLKGKSLFRILLIWPYSLPPAVAGVIFLFLFNEQSGMVNYLLKHLLDISPPWLSKSTLAMGVVITAFVWKMIGYNVVFYLAALQNIPKEIIEAAKVEGASILQTFFKVTLPMLSPITLFLIVTNTIAAFFESFTFIDLITKGGPSDSTTVIIYSIYRDGFEYFKTGLAAAESVILFTCVVVLTLIQMKVSKRMVHYER
ncbi:carbohydrate ABC transporter permease [Desulfurobacterium atlanticum]|uniref:Carbohydrate ABC transporter membrane protein 1, CUT1 family n=1 Tax=Desulfurobacterium atlanticum TaxID=240169 RepID=A0A238Y7M5_9BACT|nr:sugar ABC transporter permease [Desulfurobacterium atlanticum]SNR66653.1 carbohydrate ABC transporter membrane protein 1, CUT1 family [Desulfurobacterium atlanticum]